LQLEIDCIEWALKKVEVNKLPIDRLEAVTRVLIKDLEKRKDKAMERSDTDDLWIKIESLQWVLFVIFAIKNERMVVIWRFLPHLRSSRFSYEIIYTVSNSRQTMNTKLFFTAIAIVATFSIALTAITTNVSAQNMTGGNMTSSNTTQGASGENMTDAGQISDYSGEGDPGPEGAKCDSSAEGEPGC
jgi:hypothetical protein